MPECVDVNGDSSAKKSETEVDFAVSNSKKVKCPQCDGVMFKKNLLLHMQRKHEKKAPMHHVNLTGSCVDNENGVYLVSE